MSRLLRVALLLAALVVAKSCQPPDCDHVDCGTCGNACCILNVTFPMAAKTVYSAMIETLKKGGDDGRYTFTGSEDMTHDNMTAKYIIQSNHMTLVHHYNDTQNFLLYADNEMSTTVRAFSISKIYGAYCDYGQNYKNLIGYVKGLGVKEYKVVPVMGCPPPHATVKEL
ncbi:uncharacterized protein LOC134183570 [Corticium candelabrum]|uniref:uncharacterized protein LOC134183570 n=1 Tax=Corticium candelabrum TaxID=121492 RepID=UPI002E261FCC|nr:uncharacterized protein LOC134183570 [Corticium candelabrum]